VTPPAMSSTQARTRRRQRTAELCAATIRALTGEADVHFRGARLYRGEKWLPMRAPHLHPREDDDVTSLRGAADGMALRLVHSDGDLHSSLAPAEPVRRLVFDLLEQFRVESLAPERMRGITANLRRRHLAWSRAFHESGLTATARGLLLYTVAQICRSRVTAEPVLEQTEELIEATRFALAPAIGRHLAGLRRERTDQRRYAAHALAIAGVVDDLAGEDAEAADDRADGDDRIQFPLFVDTESDQQGGAAMAESGTSDAFGEHARDYRIFTTEYDRHHEVTSLVRAEQLREFRARLDDTIAAQGINIGRIARELGALLADPVRDGWDPDKEEGHIDGRTLSRLITSPTERRLFRTERVDPVANCQVTLLIDCSGSMGRHAESVAVIADVLARALDLAGASSEILGFTTGAWHGGRALRDWKRAGRPRRPGRLNELCHLVFKDADTPWRRARTGIAGLLRRDLFREGLDGEAVEWACARMARRPEQRRRLIVLSDGSPMDGATALTNDAHYIDNHLTDVVRRQERAGYAAIYGLGFGLDLSPYYRRSHALDPALGTSMRAFREIIGMLAR
jgi:cobaltochelatase CobT